MTKVTVKNISLTLIRWWFFDEFGNDFRSSINWNEVDIEAENDQIYFL